MGCMSRIKDPGYGVLLSACRVGVRRSDFTKTVGLINGHLNRFRIKRDGEEPPYRGKGVP